MNTNTATLGVHQQANEADPQQAANKQSLATAVHDLMRKQDQWEAALAAYQAANATAEKVADFKEHLEMLMFARQGAGSPDKELEALNDRLDELQNDASDHQALLKLIRTPVPNWVAYRLKAQLTNQEGYKDDAAEWLLRDVDALLGVPAEEA